MTLKLGVIGLSDGNGHPYSWSAICNGYSTEHMSACEFPVIPQYLSEQSWPAARLPGVEVTHIWTQNAKLSHRVAKASMISQVVDEPEAMLGQIDALLLARDDAENHLAFAQPFLKAGMPVYIDKPIALSLRDLDALYQLEQYEGQIFSCSALRYAKELMLSESDRDRIGPIRHLLATTPKSWEKYAVHIIEPSLQIIDATADIARMRSRTVAEGGRSVSVSFGNSLTADFTAFGKGVSGPLSIRIFGEKNWIELPSVNTFPTFKTALSEFVEGVRTKTRRSPIQFNRQVVSIIEAGLNK